MAMALGLTALGVRGFLLEFRQHAAVLTRFKLAGALKKVINARFVLTWMDFSYASYDNSMENMNDAGHLS